MGSFWMAIYIISLVMITCLLPFAIFFYETDPDNTIFKRLLSAFIYTLITVVLVVILVFATWAFLRYVRIPVDDVTLTSTNSFILSNNAAVITSYNVAVIY